MRQRYSRGVNWSGVDLLGANVEDADLSGASPDRCDDLMDDAKNGRFTDLSTVNSRLTA